MEHYPSDTILLSIAAENNLAETAFLVVGKDGYQLRWFIPVLEVPLCGHATLATAAVVLERLESGCTEAAFNTLSGLIPVRRNGPGYILNLPSRPSVEIPVSVAITDALGMKPVAVLQNQFNYMAILESADAVRNCLPDFGAIAQFDRPGCIVTARGDEIWDFVSRYFAPQKGIPEDPVTGAAHCMLAPYW